MAICMHHRDVPEPVMLKILNLAFPARKDDREERRRFLEIEPGAEYEYDDLRNEHENDALYLEKTPFSMFSGQTFPGVSGN